MARVAALATASIACCCSGAHAEVVADRVHSLPGFHGKLLLSNFFDHKATATASVTVRRRGPRHAWSRAPRHFLTASRAPRGCGTGPLPTRHWSGYIETTRTTQNLQENEPAEPLQLKLG